MMRLHVKKGLTVEGIGHERFKNSVQIENISDLCIIRQLMYGEVVLETIKAGKIY